MNIDYNAVIEILKSFLNNEKIEILGISVGEERQVKDAIKNLLTAYEKEKEKNKKLTERVLKLESDKFWDNVVSKNKLKEIIYPTPENEIPIEVQQSDMYKKLVKKVEE